MSSAAESSTYEVWKFGALGDILAMSTMKDVSGDGIDELVVAAQDKSVYLLDGATGSKIWAFTGNSFYTWIGAITSPSLDVNGDDKPEIIAATKDKLIMLLDGATGKQIWNFSASDNYQPKEQCFPAAHSAHLMSDIDGDGLPDVVIVSGSGDQCPKDDKIIALALSTKSGKKIWEYVHEQDYHGLKDGTMGSSPAVAIDINKDGIKDIAIADDRDMLYIINGRTGTEIGAEKLGALGTIWNFVAVPDISGDGVDDAIALEFIDGGGGPDYAAVEAIDLVSFKVLWQAKVGDGLYEGGAVYSVAWLAGNDSAAAHLAATQRIDSDLQVVTLDARTGKQSWLLHLGEDKSRDDTGKYYPVARVPDLNRNNHDEVAVGSVDAKIYLLDGSDGGTIWSYSVSGGSSRVASIQAKDGQKYIVVADKSSVIRALAGLTQIKTSLTIGVSAQTVTPSSKLVVSGSVSPPFPGEIVILNYIDPTGKVTTKPIVIAKDGSYADEVKPELVGSWKVSARFDGEGYYLDSATPTISFAVENKTKDSVYKVEVKADDGTSVSYPVEYFIEGGQVTDMSVNRQQKSLDVAITSTGGGALKIQLSRVMIDAAGSTYQVYVDGKVATFQETESGSQTRTLSIPFPAGSKQVQIIGTYVVPEFSAIALIVLALAVAGTMAATRDRLFTS